MARFPGRQFGNCVKPSRLEEGEVVTRSPLKNQLIHQRIKEPVHEVRGSSVPSGRYPDLEGLRDTVKVPERLAKSTVPPRLRKQVSGLAKGW